MMKGAAGVYPTTSVSRVSWAVRNEIESKNVYVPYVNINNFMFQHFGEFEYKHTITALLEKLLNRDVGKPTMLVNVSNTKLDIVVIADNKLQLCNTFKTHTKEDFLYYILFVAEQLQMSPEDFELNLMGDISKEDRPLLLQPVQPWLGLALSSREIDLTNK